MIEVRKAFLIVLSVIFTVILFALSRDTLDGVVLFSPGDMQANEIERISEVHSHLQKVIPADFLLMLSTT